MHCIVLSAPRGKETWELRRSIEVLGYHREDEEVRILFLLYAENKLPVEEGENCLWMMHRGNVKCWWKPSWPLPLHVDEENAGIAPDQSVLMKLYGEAFERARNGEREGDLCRVNTLLPWDAWEPTEPKIVNCWRPCNHPAVMADPSERMLIAPQLPLPPANEDVPFTSWRIGNFMQPGLFLLTFALSFSGESYRRLVGPQAQFTVDGPRHLIMRTKYDVLNRPDRELWNEQLALFEREPVLPEKGYDVIVLNPPLADSLKTLAPSGMALAPRQPEDNGHLLGSRFVTLNHEFTMLAQYANHMVGEENAQLVG